MLSPWQQLKYLAEWDEKNRLYQDEMKDLFRKEDGHLLCPSCGRHGLPHSCGVCVCCGYKASCSMD